MRRLTIPVLWAAGAILAGGCATNPPPVPVTGREQAMAELAGRWVGEYRGFESGRTGSIVFTLAPGRDTAYGDVLMVPAQTGEPTWSGEVPPGMRGMPRPDERPLRIGFVRAGDGWVSGTLEPYRDPVCGCLLETRFTGVLRDDTIEGSFTSRHQMSGRVDSGRWQVRRTAR